MRHKTFLEKKSFKVEKDAIFTRNPIITIFLHFFQIFKLKSRSIFLNNKSSEHLSVFWRILFLMCFSNVGFPFWLLLKAEKADFC